MKTALRSAQLPSQEMSDDMQKKADSDSIAETTAGASEDNAKRGRTRRFAHASGDRPLDGYTIKRGVGTGGFGEVYYATTDAGKEVALKRIERNLDIELRGVRQCLNLKHPNLVAVFDIKYDKDEQAWVVMEFVSGESLAEVVERNPNGMPLDVVHHWFDGVTAGVAHLHESGIVHRDLKPGNIFSDQSTVKIGDYGLSKFISCSRRSGHTQSVGTFHYMAPEVGQGKYGKEIDIYALGIMLYEMLTGQVPYEGESSHEIIMKHLTAQPVLTGIPEPYRSIISTSLSKDPAARKYSVQQMREIVAGHEPGTHATAIDAPVIDNATASAAASAPLFQGMPVESGRVAFSFADDPVAQGVHRAYHDLARGWQQTKFGTATKLGIVLLAIPLALYNSRLLLPMVLVTALTYGVYFLIRGLVLYTSNDEGFVPSPDGTLALAGDAGGEPKSGEGDAMDLIVAERSPASGPIMAELVPMNRVQRRHVRERKHELQKVDRERDLRRMRTSLRERAGVSRFSDMIGSWILATMVCAVAGLIFLVSRELINGGSAMRELPMVMWAVMTSAVAATGLITIAKSWESTTGGGLPRRLFQLIVGMATGCAAWGLQQYMELMPGYIINANDIEGVVRDEAPNAFYNAGGLPTLLGYVAFFGLLFTIVRWWRQADPIRGTRLSIWRTVLSGVAGFAVYVFFPVPGGILVGLTTSVAVQIAAKYMDHEERRLVCDNLLS